MCANSILLCTSQHMYSNNYMYLYVISSKKFKQNLLQDLITFRNIGLLSWMEFHTSTKHHLITSGKKSVKLFLSRIISFSDSIYTHILTSSDTIFSKGPGYGKLYSVDNLYQSTALSNLLPTNIWLNLMSVIYDYFFFALPKLFT